MRERPCWAKGGRSGIASTRNNLRLPTLVSNPRDRGWHVLVSLAPARDWRATSHVFSESGVQRSRLVTFAGVGELATHSEFRRRVRPPRAQWRAVAPRRSS